MKLRTLTLALSLAAASPIVYAQTARADNCDNVGDDSINDALAQQQANLAQVAGGWHTPEGRRLEEQSQETATNGAAIGNAAHQACEALENSMGLNNNNDGDNN
jgi:hypothetical protein